MADEVVNTIEDLHAINDAYDQLLCDEAPTSYNSSILQVYFRDYKR